MSADVKVDDLGPFGVNLAAQNGESLRVCSLAERPSWLYKQYLAPLPPAEADRLAQVIEVPSRMTREQSALLGRHVAWPDSRVVNDAGRTIGVLLPEAPDAYRYDWKLPSGRQERRLLEVDVLALPENVQVQRRLPPQQLLSRLKVCASIAAVGSLFEKHGLVYLDWSYSNVFWSVHDQTAFVIDMDGCSFGPRAQIHQPGWDDPLVPHGLAGNECDRYRMALLIARCLTGERIELAKTRTTLGSLRLGRAMTQAIDLILLALSAPSTDARPSVARISAALSAAAGTAPPPADEEVGRVKGWTPTGKTRPVRSPPPPPPPPPPPWRSADPLAPPSGAGTNRSTRPFQSAPGRQPSSYSVTPPVRPSSTSAGMVLAGAILVIALIVIVLVVIL